MKRALTFVVAVSLGMAVLDAAADWPQWQGPDRTRISKETGLLEGVARQRPEGHLDGEWSRVRLWIDGRGR